MAVAIGARVSGHDVDFRQRFEALTSNSVLPGVRARRVPIKNDLAVGIRVAEKTRSADLNVSTREVFDLVTSRAAWIWLLSTTSTPRFAAASAGRTRTQSSRFDLGVVAERGHRAHRAVMNHGPRRLHRQVQEIGGLPRASTCRV
jgi:hypothetical protein